MNLKPEQLTAWLEQKGLSPVYMISGDEPLQLTEAADAVRLKAREQGIKERIVLDVEAGFDWRALMDIQANPSLFSVRRLIELKMGTNRPGKDGGAILVTYTEQNTGNDVLMITAAKLDKRNQQSRWYKSLDQFGVAVQVWPVQISKLPDWICQRAKKYNKNISKDAAQLIAEQVEGNLLAASQEIEKLCLLVSDSKITVDDALATVVDNARHDVFALIESAYANEVKRLVRILNGLRNEGVDPMAIYGALSWDYRRLCTMAYHFSKGVTMAKLFSDYRIWDPSRKRAVKAMLDRHETKKLYRLLRRFNHLERVIKSTDKQLIWGALLEFLLELSGRLTIGPDNIESYLTAS